MPLSKNKLNEIICGFVELVKVKIPIEKVYLFGSYSTQSAKEYSDIDLAIISNWFINKPHIENLQLLNKIAVKYNSLIEAVPFTKDEFENLDKRTFLAQILKTGKPIQIT